MKNIIARQLPALVKEGNVFTEVQQGKERRVCISNQLQLDL